MRRYPQGSVRGAELSLDEKGQSASSGGSCRHPARRLVVAGPPGTPAHWHISTGRAAVLLAVNGLLPRESLLHPFREVRRCFFQAARPATPGAADCQARSPPGPSRLAAETLLTPGRRNDPCTTRPPSPPLLCAGRPLTSRHQHDHPTPSPTLSRTTRTPSPSEHHALDTTPPCPATRTPGPHCPRKTTHSRPAELPRRRMVMRQPDPRISDPPRVHDTRAPQPGRHRRTTRRAPRSQTRNRGPPHPAHLTASTPISVSRRFALQSH